MPLERLVSKNRAPLPQSTGVNDAVARTVTSAPANAVTRGISQTVTITETSLNRLSTKMRPLVTQTTTISENITRIRGKTRLVPTQTITIGAGSTSKQMAKIRTLIQNIARYELLDVFKNGIKLVAPQAPDKGGSGKMALYPKGPRLKQIKYPVYIVSERRRLERRRRLRERQEFAVIIPAFKYNINKVVAPFVVINPIKHTVNVHFALKNSQNVRFTGKIIPVQIPISSERRQIHKAKSTFLMNPRIAERGRGKKLVKVSQVMKVSKIQKMMTLFLLATTTGAADEAGVL